MCMYMGTCICILTYIGIQLCMYMYIGTYVYRNYNSTNLPDQQSPLLLKLDFQFYSIVL